MPGGTKLWFLALCLEVFQFLGVLGVPWGAGDHLLYTSASLVYKRVIAPAHQLTRLAPEECVCFLLYVQLLPLNF